MGRAGALTGQPELDNFSPPQNPSAHLTSHRTTLSTTPRPVGALDGERPTGVLVTGNGVLTRGGELTTKVVGQDHGSDERPTGVLVLGARPWLTNTRQYTTNTLSR